MGAGERLHDDEKCDGRDQDGTRDKTSRLMTAAFFAVCSGWLSGRRTIRHCTFQGWMRPTRPRRGAGLTTGDVDSVRVRHEVVDDLFDDVVRKLDGQFVGMDRRHGTVAEHRM